MPGKKHITNPSKKISSTIPTALSEGISVTDNPFTYLNRDIETKERMVDTGSKKELHEKMDSIWKLLISDRRKCRSLLYQLWAAILIERDDELKDLIESILLDPKMGDQHISRLPRLYYDKMMTWITKDFLEKNDVQGNVNKYAQSLNKWYGDLIEQIKKQVGDDYLIKDPNNYYIINPAYREKIREIIINDPKAKKIREELNLSVIQPEQKEVKSSPEKPKTGMDYYIDYLLEDDDERAGEALKNAVKEGYAEDSPVKSKDVVSDEYYCHIFNKYMVEGNNYKLMETILISGANKGSAIAQHILSNIYEYGVGIIPKNNANTVKYCKMAANLGYPVALHDLAHIYLRGLNGVEKNVSEALRLFNEAANQDYALSLNDLGCLYNGQYGEVVEKNTEIAVNLWEKAIKLNCKEGKNSLGNFYIENGKKDEGHKLIKEAANEGSAIARSNLGVYYIKGILPGDILEGIKLIEKAAAQNYDIAIKMLENKTFFNNLRDREKHTKYYILAHELMKPGVKEKLKSLIKNLEFSAEFVKSHIVEEQGTQWLKMPLPADIMKEEIRELLAIKSVKFKKITPRQQQELQNLLPLATIENHQKDNSKMLITWPIDAKGHTQEIIKQFIDKLEVTKQSEVPPSSAVTSPEGTVEKSKANAQFKQ